ncbi:BNR repeat protein [Arcicella aurantiaca]|uniref:BNR repeat protein n=1 Tax=Arcicella aurantiaca TaxID=591202 RepID=A0A316DIG7_9BACT|nr:sialidase family protein [Arcicella aurantiaca]PWK18057.1 BNR repeat protein [Arcicella aurantiaca]
MIKLIISFQLLLLGIGAFFSTKKVENTSSEIAVCHSIIEDNNFSNVNPDDTTKAYSMPLLAQTPKGDVMLSWTEKNADGVTSFCVAFSKDKGKTFSDKKVIFAGTGIANSRMMRAKVLTKKDGSLVAVFSNRGESAPPQAQNPPHADGHSQGGTPPQNQPAPPQGGRGGGRSSNIVYCVSTDGGNTWTKPESVDSDPKQGIVRGFFDAVVLPNDEVAVAYLKDVANSTKHEERDLRMVVTKGGKFQPERVIDPVVCDCCPISMLIDANGALNIVYRDNNDNIRDMAKMVSTDNAETFSKPQILHNDEWKINGCPHSGAVATTAGKGSLFAWYSGAEKETGIRLVSSEGKKLVVLSESSAKNAALAEGSQNQILLWEQNKPENNLTQIAFKKVNKDNVSETIWVDGSLNGINSTGLVLDNQLLVAYEVKQANKRNSLKISTVRL